MKPNSERVLFGPTAKTLLILAACGWLILIGNLFPVAVHTSGIVPVKDDMAGLVASCLLLLILAMTPLVLRKEFWQRGKPGAAAPLTDRAIPAVGPRKSSVKRLLGAFSSIHLTLYLLSSSVILVFFGTLDQVHYGIWFTQQKYFEHVLVTWQYPLQWLGGPWLQWFYLPLPGGYALGPLLVINLACAHLRYFRPSWNKAGIPLIHAGIVILLLGQLWTQLRQEEFFLWLAEGERANFVESFHDDEWVLIRHGDDGEQRVYSWPGTALQRPGRILSHPQLPFTTEVIWYARNAAIFQRPEASVAAFPRMPFNRGIGAERDLVALAQTPTFAEGERNVKSAIVRLRSGDNEIGTWLVSNLFRQTAPVREVFPLQTFSYAGATWELALRFKRDYLPADIELLQFNHDRYPGTDIPFNFSSEVRLHEHDSGLSRDTLIYMNHPLRYAGLTFYQASFADNDTKSMFQVVRNPARWIPYLATTITTLGLLVQFLISLVSHTAKRRAAA